MKKIMLFVYVFLLSFLFACSASKSPSMSDSAFLSAIETSVLDRMTTSAEDKTDKNDYLLIVNKELAYLQEFETAEFSDSQLADIAKKYIDGLNLQKEALSAAHVWEAQPWPR